MRPITVNGQLETQSLLSPDLSSSQELINPEFKQDPNSLQSLNTVQFNKYENFIRDCSSKKNLTQSAAGALLLTISTGFFNLFLCAVTVALQRLAILILSFLESGDTFLAVVYVRSIQNIFGEFMLFSSLIVINTEVGKLLGSHQKSKINKVLLYSLILSTGYIFVVFIPMSFCTTYYLPKITYLSDHVKKLLIEINYATFLPIAIQNLNFSLDGYLLSIGLSWAMSRISFLVPAASLLAPVLSYFYWRDGLLSYYIMIWTGSLTKLGLNIYFYRTGARRLGKLRDLKIEWSKFYFFLKKMISNMAVEFFEFVNLEFVLLMSSVVLQKNKNALIAFLQTILVLFADLTVSIRKLPFMIFSKFLGKNEPGLAKYCFFFSLLTEIVLIIPLSALYILICSLCAEMSFKKDPEIQNMVNDYILYIWPFLAAKPLLSHAMDGYKALDMRFEAGLFVVFNLVFTVVIFCWGIWGEADLVTCAFLSYPLPVFVTMVVAISFLFMKKWKKVFGEIESMEEMKNGEKSEKEVKN